MTTAADRLRRRSLEQRNAPPAPVQVVESDRDRLVREAIFGDAPSLLLSDALKAAAIEGSRG